MPLPERLLLDRMASPLGEMLLVTDAAGILRAADFHDHAARMQRLLRLHYGALAPEAGTAPSAVRHALARYFAGEFAALGEVAWATAGTAFQRAVWAALVRIPCGQTTTYGALAVQLGRPAAMRAVGAANGANPISIVVPCHRLVGANGALTGYGGGLPRKQWLLRHEGALA
jgi:methylated-DNA-[protein]-cysteine S-methyltransferase